MFLSSSIRRLLAKCSSIPMFIYQSEFNIEHISDKKLSITKRIIHHVGKEACTGFVLMNTNKPFIDRSMFLLLFVIKTNGINFLCNLIGENFNKNRVNSLCPSTIFSTPASSYVSILNASSSMSMLSKCRIYVEKLDISELNVGKYFSPFLAKF